MTGINRREILAVLGSIAALAGAPGLAQPSADAIDLSAGKAIGRAYLKANPQVSLPQLRRTHLPDGLRSEALTRLRVQAAGDFREGRVFVHEGWRLSVTEAQLFALLTLVPS